MLATDKELDAILRNDFCAFLQRCFSHLNPGARFDRNWHHEAIAYQLGRVFRGDVTRLVANGPPRSLKSMIASVAFPAWIIGKRPTAKFICASYSQDLANKHAGDFRKIVQSSWYRELFRPAAPLKDSEAEYQTTEGGFRLATSVGGTLTGRGADYILIDDPLSASDAFSNASRERVNQWFSGSLMSRLDDKRSGKIITIMQRLHQDDLTGFLLEQPDWEHLNLPAIAPADTAVRLSDLRMHEWKMGEPLDPVREPLHLLERLKKQLGSIFFSAQYLQNPVPPGGNMLKADWIREFEFPPTRQSGDQLVQSWDTAMKAGDGNDFSACLTFMVRDKNQYFLLDVYRARLEFPELAKFVCAHAKRFNATAILIEDKASGTSLVQYVKRNGLQGVVPVKPSSDKESRMYGQTPKLEAGSLYLPKFAPWREDFISEYLAFPKAKYDDQIDALSQFLEWRVNREDAVFEFDFGFDDDVAGPRRSFDYWLGI
jgi:predicted phage terminase large subunit-like protein